MYFRIIVGYAPNVGSVKAPISIPNALATIEIMK
jgi:hypothetical protein